MAMDDAYFLTQKPKNSALAPYISYYYFHSVRNAQGATRFAYYPNYKNALTIYKNSSIQFSENSSKSTPNAAVPYSMLYSGIQNTVRTAELIAPFTKIGIVFEAFGIAPFMNNSFALFPQDPIDKSFDFFGEALEKCCDQVNAAADLDQKVALLDHFFVDRLPLSVNSLLKNSIDFILNTEKRPTVNSICEQLGVNRKTLLRLFQKELGCSVKDYIHIVQFRKALNHYLLTNSKESLTALALDGDYYDQSQFIAHFKKLTGFNPSAFFKRVNRLGQEDTFWTFD